MSRITYLSQLLESCEALNAGLPVKVVLTYWSMLLGGVIVGLAGFAQLSSDMSSIVAKSLYVTGILSFFFSSGVTATIASAGGFQANFLRSARRGTIIVGLILLAIAVYLLLEGDRRGIISNFQALGVLYAMIAILAWLQIGLGLGIGRLLRRNSQGKID